MRRTYPAVLGPVLLSALFGCVDTSVPDTISRELGEGRTDGPFCTPEALDYFPPDELRLHVIDVGQGDALWIQTPWYENQLLESRNILIDAGPSGSVPGTSQGGDIVVTYMIEHGMVVGDVLHGLVITHAHEDHYGGVPTVVSTFTVERYVDPGFTAQSQGFISARAAAETDVRNVNGKIGVPAVGELVPRIYAATDLFGEYVEAQVIWASSTPPGGNVSDPSGTDINNTSVALAVRWGQNQMLLLADLEAEVEAALIAANDSGEFSLASRVLKVAHHGSSSSSSPGFLARVFPSLQKSPSDWAVISSGRRSFGGTTLPTEETLNSLKNELEEYHILSTENRDDIKTSGTEHGDDHILVRMKADGTVEACYGF